MRRTLPVILAGALGLSMVMVSSIDAVEPTAYADVVERPALVQSAPLVAALPSVGFAQALFDRSGTPPIFGANELVEVYAGTISYVGGRTPGAKFGACTAVPAVFDNPNLKRVHPGIDDFFQPFADIYIVPAGQTFSTNQRLRDAAGEPNSVIGGLGGGYVFEPLGITFPTGRISAGRYDLVVDECQNGYFDGGEDSVIRDAFQVQLQQNVPPLDPAAAEFLEVKARAQAATRAGDTLDQLIKIYKTYKAATEIYGAIAAPIKTMVTIIGGQVLGAIGITNPYTELKKWGEGVRDQVMAQVRTRTRRIAADPPQSDYKRFAVPIVAGGSFDDGRTELDEALAAYIANVDAMSGISLALLDAMERYQGADEVGDALWALRHARTLQELAPLQEAVGVALDASAVRLAAVLDGRRDAFVFGTTIGNADRAVDLGLRSRNAKVSADVLNAGLPVDGLSAKADDWERRVVGANLMDLNSSGEWADAIEASTADFAAFLAAGADMATLADGLVPQLEAETGEADTDPLLDITVTGTPAAGATVDATAGPVPAGVDVEWDLDADGEFDDATGATIPWTLAGDALVGSPLFISARVVGVDGESGADGAIELVIVEAGGNRAPEIPLADVDEPGRFEVAPGESATINVVATDADGDPLTYEWFVEDRPQSETTDSFTFATPGDRVGAYAIEVFVSDDAGATTRATFLVEAVTEDVDRDGFMATPGPDCLDDQADAPAGVLAARVNPGRDEVVNSYDDDCDGIVDEETGGTMSPVPELGVDFEPRILTGRNITEGDQLSIRTAWSHANQFLGADNDGNYLMTWDWGDGTTTSRLLAGTTFDEMRTFVFESHRYAEQSAGHYLQVCWEWLDDPAEVNLRRCTTTDNRLNEILVLNDRPFVNAADLRTWSDSQFVPPTNGRPPTDEWTDLDPDGRGVIANGNPSNGLVVASREPIGPGGYGRFAISHEVLESGDNDLIGAVFGFDPDFDVDPVAANGPEGEGYDPDAEFIGAIWGNEAEDLGGQNRNYIPFDECGGSAPDVSVDPGIDPLTVWKHQGLPNFLEATALLTFDVPDATEPSCADADGITRIGSIDGDLDSDDIVMADVWRVRTLDGNSLGTLVTDPYFVEYEYQPDSITIWVNGVEQGRIDNPGPDPFPPANGGLFTRSQGSVRASASAPEPVFRFVQGKGGEFWDTDPATGDPVLPDGITMPMTDGPADEHTATIDWGDGTSTSEGTVTPDPATGFGWFTIAGDHVYETPGEYRGNVCAEDDEGLGSCFPFRAIVDNAPPRVDAGTDRTVGADVTLADMTFQDPGATDTHTASIDWGDGTVTTGVIEADRGGGTVTGTHTFAAGGEYTLELCVTDLAAATTCDTRVLEVRNGAVDPRAPEVDIEDAGTTPGEVGGDATLGALASDWNVDDALRASIDWGDGTVEAPASTRSAVGCDDPEVTPSSDPATTTVDPDCQLFAALSGEHRYAENGSYQVVVEVCDGSGRCDTDRITLNITGVEEPEPEPTIPFLVPLDPARLLETRSGPGLATVDGLFLGGGVVAAGSTLELKVTGRGGVPGSGVDAGVLNVTAVPGGAGGFVTLFPCGDRPNASSLNFVSNSVPNELIAKLSASGTVCLYAHAATHLVVDVTGYVPTGSDYEALDPARLLETRSGPGLATVDGLFLGGGVVAAGSTLELKVTGRGGVPGSGVDAGVLNVTAVPGGAGGFVTLFPCGDRPNASSLNFVSNSVPNELIAKLSASGTVCLYAHAATHLVVDVTGYVPTGSDYEALDPARLLETRSGPGLATVDGLFLGGGVVAAGSTLELKVTGRGGVPGSGVDAGVLNVTAVPGGAGGFVTLFPCGDRPNASSLNFVSNSVPNELIAKLSASGTVCLYAHAATHLVVDVTGYVPTP